MMREREDKYCKQAGTNKRVPYQPQNDFFISSQGRIKKFIPRMRRRGT